MTAITQSPRVVHDILRSDISVEVGESDPGVMLDNLVDFLGAAVTEAGLLGNDDERITASMEDLAVDDLGFGSVGNLLTRLTNMDEVLNRIDSRLGSVLQAVEHEILPSSSNDANILTVAGSNSLVFETRQQERVKSILYSLSENFNLDVEDTSQVELYAGAERSTGEDRKNGYIAIDVPSLGKTVLVRDRLGNMTYILSTEEANRVAVELGLGMDASQLDKSDIATLIKDNPQAGVDVRYTPHYFDNVTEALDSDDLTGLSWRKSRKETEGKRVIVSELEFDDEVLSTVGLGDLLGVHAASIRNAVKRLAAKGDIDPEGDEAYFGNRPGRAFGISEQRLIAKHLDERGTLLPKLPTEYETIRSLDKLVKDVFGVKIGQYGFKQARDFISEELGVVEEFNVSGRTEGLSPSQQDLVLQKLEEQGYFLDADEFMSVKATAAIFDVDPVTLESVMSELGLQSVPYRGKSRGVSIKLHDSIQEGLESRGLVERVTEEADVQYVEQFADEIGLSPTRIYNAISTIKERKSELLGDVKQYKKDKRSAIGLDARQRRALALYVGVKGYLNENDRIDNSLTTVGEASKELGISHTRLLQHLREKEFQEAIGPTGFVLVGEKNRRITGLTPEQVETIREIRDRRYSKAN